MEKPQKNSFRFEKKFVVNSSNYDRLHIELMLNGYSPVYYERRINNLYLDDNCLKAFYENNDGVSERVKNRLRWYGDLFGKNKVTLEKKIKSDISNRKEAFKLGSFELASLGSLHTFLNTIKEELLNRDQMLFRDIFEMQATLLNSYSREYLLSNDGKIRVTIDRDIYSYSPQTEQSEYRNDFIIEFKSSVDDPILNVPILNNISKSSKYCQGMISTNCFLFE